MSRFINSSTTPNHTKHRSGGSWPLLIHDLLPPPGMACVLPKFGHTDTLRGPE
jgi:hypothetical protein